MSSSGRPLLWDVDTQVDFVAPDGKLAVPGAEQVGARDGTARAMGPRGRGRPPRDRRRPRADRSGDLGHARLREHLPTPLPAGHAGGGEDPRDAAGRIRSRSPSPRIRRASSASVAEGRRELLLLKKSFDAFTNPNAEPLLEALDPSEVIVFGVATDVCDHAAIMGLLRRGRTGHVRRGCGPRAVRGARRSLPRRVACREASASRPRTRSSRRCAERRQHFVLIRHKVHRATRG